MPPEFGLQTYIDAILAGIGRTDMPAFRCDLFSTAAAILAQNLAVAFVTRRAAQERITAGRAVPIDQPIARTFDRYVTTRVGRRLLLLIVESPTCIAQALPAPRKAGRRHAVSPMVKFA